MPRKKLLTLFAVLLFASAAAVSLAADAGDAAVGLGEDLTPMGAEQKASSDGKIPAWEGGITTPPEGYSPGDHHPDPFADDKILFTIDSTNVDKYADQMTAGHQALVKTYDTFSMNVYPSRRSASAPQRIYDATKKNVSTAELVSSGNGVTGAVIGIPFPIPENGLEVLWNHILRWRGNAVERRFVKVAVTRGGKYTLIKKVQRMNMQYSQAGMTEEALNNVILQYRGSTLAPAKLAGRMTLVHETMDQEKDHRKAWTYNPGQRRVRRAPNLAFDNPDSNGDGLTVTDQIDMFNGSPERYDWKLIGKKEIYVPYNSYKLHSDSLKYKDILKPGHLNPDYLRYELHRVWVVEATLKEGFRHIYKRRTLYFDEDSWQILAVDIYDNRDQLWRVSAGHGINYYEVPTFWTTVEVNYDLQAGRYAATLLNNQESMYEFSDAFDVKEFTTTALRQLGFR